MNSRFQRPLLGLALLSCLTLPGCLFGNNSHTETTGQFVSSETLTRVQPGQTTEFVLGLLGEPTSKAAAAGETPEQDVEIWKWSYSEDTEANASVFLIFGTKSSTNSSGNTYVEFSEGKVVKAWRD